MKKSFGKVSRLVKGEARGQLVDRSTGRGKPFDSTSRLYSAEVYAGRRRTLRMARMPLP